MPKSAESGRSFSSLSAPFCRKSTWTWWPVISTEQHGANPMVTTPNLTEFWRTHLPTRIFRCRQAPHRFGADRCVWVCQAPELVWHMGGSSARSLHNSSREIKVATRYGYTWTLSAIDMHTSHEETMSNMSSSRKGPAPTRLTKRKAGTTMKVIAHFHLCRRYVDDIGISVALETYRFHTIYSIRRKSSWRIFVVRGEINKKTADIQARSSMARPLEVNGKARQAEGEAKVV